MENEKNPDVNEELSLEQVKSIVNEHENVISDLNAIRTMTLIYIDRYNDLCTRVNFSKKKPGKQEQWQKRLFVARNKETRLVSELHELNTQLEMYRNNLRDLEKKA